MRLGTDGAASRERRRMRRKAQRRHRAQRRISTPTFSSIQREIFNTTDSSGRAGVHPVPQRSGQVRRAPEPERRCLVRRTWSERPAANKAGAVRVIPGDPDNSYLIQKLEGGPESLASGCHAQAGPYLTAGQMLGDSARGFSVAPRTTNATGGLS